MHKPLSRYQWLPEKMGSWKGTVGGQRYLCLRPLGMPTLVTKGCPILHSHSIGQRTHFWHCWYFLCKTYLLTYKAEISVGLPCSSNGKESACNVGNQGSIPGWGRSSGEGNGNPLHYYCLEGPGGYSLLGHKELNMADQLTRTRQKLEPWLFKLVCLWLQVGWLFFSSVWTDCMSVILYGQFQNLKTERFLRFFAYLLGG